MQLAIKDYDPMAEYHDDGIAQLTVTCALLVHAQRTKSQMCHVTIHTRCDLPNSTACSQFYKLRVNSTDLSRFDKLNIVIYQAVLLYDILSLTWWGVVGAVSANHWFMFTFISVGWAENQQRCTAWRSM